VYVLVPIAYSTMAPSNRSRLQLLF